LSAASRRQPQSCGLSLGLAAPALSHSQIRSAGTVNSGRWGPYRQASPPPARHRVCAPAPRGPEHGFGVPRWVHLRSDARLSTGQVRISQLRPETEWLGANRRVRPFRGALRSTQPPRATQFCQSTEVTSTDASAWDLRCRDTHRTDEQTAWNQQWKGPITRTKLKDHPARGQFDRYGNDDRPDGAAGEDGCGRLGVRSDRRKPQP
jgi:hypothetical protein